MTVVERVVQEIDRKPHLIPITIIYGDKDDAVAWSVEVDAADVANLSKRYLNDGYSIRGTMKEVIDDVVEQYTDNNLM